MSNENMLPIFREIPAINELKTIRVTLPPGSVSHNVLTKMEPYTGMTNRSMIEFIVLDWLNNSPEWLEALAINDIERIQELWREKWTSRNSTGK